MTVEDNIAQAIQSAEAMMNRYALQFGVRMTASEAQEFRGAVQMAFSGVRRALLAYGEELRNLPTSLHTASTPATQATAEIQWPKARDVGRLHDMSPRGHLRVGLDGDSDVYVEVFNDQQESVASVEFCNPGSGGGGRSSQTRRALIALMVAMEADNAERPDLDWWALRMGASGSQPSTEQR